MSTYTYFTPTKVVFGRGAEEIPLQAAVGGGNAPAPRHDDDIVARAEAALVEPVYLAQAAADAVAYDRAAELVRDGVAHAVGGGIIPPRVDHKARLRRAPALTVGAAEIIVHFKCG